MREEPRAASSESKPWLHHAFVLAGWFLLCACLSIYELSQKPSGWFDFRGFGTSALLYTYAVYALVSTALVALLAKRRFAAGVAHVTTAFVTLGIVRLTGKLYFGTIGESIASGFRALVR